MEVWCRVWAGGASLLLWSQVFYHHRQIDPSYVRTGDEGFQDDWWSLVRLLCVEPA